MMAAAALEVLLPVCVQEVLDRMFFSQAVPVADLPPGDMICASVMFRGDLTGRCWLWLSPDAALRLAADFLGVERAGVDTRGAEDTVCELANVLCGNVVSRIGSSAAFELGPPVLGTPGNVPPRLRRHFEIDGGFLSIGFQIAPNPSEDA